MNASIQQPGVVGRSSVDHWIHRVNQICGRFQARALDERFNAGIEAFSGEAMNLYFVDVQSARLYRTRREVSGDDGKHYFAVFQLSGRAIMEQGGQTAALLPGDITLIDSCRPCDFHYDGLSRQLSLIVPRAVMDAGLRHANVRCASRITGSSHLGYLANQLILGSVKQGDLDNEEGEAAVSALITLLRPVLSGGDPANPRERAFRKAVAVIETHLCAQELTPALVAGEVGVSVRSLYRIFAEKGLVVAQYIKTRRLELCAERLRNARGEESLSALCFACGFSDTSYFSTAFKKYFGMTPRQYRDQFRGDSGGSVRHH